MSSTMIYYILIIIVTMLLLAINFILAPHNPYMEKNGAFECGYTSFLGQNRTQFSISFFIFALLFLLFDLEILLVYPYLVSSYTNEILGLITMLIFLLILVIGFAFELGKKALTIESRQTKKNFYKSSIKTMDIIPSKNLFISQSKLLRIPNREYIHKIMVNFFKTFMKKILILVLIVLPVSVLFKSLHLSYIHNNWDLNFICGCYVSLLPFGNYLKEILGIGIIINHDLLNYHIENTKLILSGGFGGCFVKSIVELFQGKLITMGINDDYIPKKYTNTSGVNNPSWQTFAMDNSNPEGRGTNNNNPSIESSKGNENIENKAKDEEWGDEKQGMAGKVNGPIKIYDPKGQVERGYDVNSISNNQPALRNLGKALEHQVKRCEKDELTRGMFTPEQEIFILRHLAEYDREMFSKIVGRFGHEGGNRFPQWTKQGNTVKFRKTFYYGYNEDNKDNN